MRKLTDKLSGKVCDDLLSSAVLQWASASQALLSLIEDGSLITADDRGLVLELLRERLDGLMPIEGFDADKLMALEGKLRASSERAARAARATEVSGG